MVSSDVMRRQKITIYAVFRLWIYHFIAFKQQSPKKITLF
jgi:hypothetical protein